jgi:uncharacterized protein
MKYKQSLYNVWVTNYPQIGSSLVYNTLQRNLLCVPSIIEDAILKCNLSGISEKDLNILLSNNILIEEDIDEEKIFKNWISRYSVDTQTLGLTFITTYLCNCRCIYCYEDGVRKDTQTENSIFVMSESKIKEFYSWTENLIKLWRPRTLDFCFHGGEPSLFPNFVDRIAKLMSEIADKNNLNRNFSIVTNCTLMTDNFIKILKNNKINRIMTTLDGPENIHNKRRPFYSGKGTFTQTFKSIKRLVKEGFRVFLGVNIDKGNINYIPELIDLLSTSGFANLPNFSILLATVKEGPHASNPYYFKKNVFSNSGQMNAFLKLYRYALNKKIKIADPIGGGLCSFRRMSSYIIDVEGNLYKCITMAGNKEAFLGNISEPINLIMRRSAQFIYMESWQRKKKCRVCKYLPLCFGGCPQQVLLKKGTYNNILCAKSYFDRYLPEAIKIKYDSNILFPKNFNSSVDTICS